MRGVSVKCRPEWRTGSEAARLRSAATGIAGGAAGWLTAAGCVGACTDGCVGACTDGCVGACTDGCVGACTDGCVGACTDGCVGACTDGC
ncbi:hypothetical protein LBW89_17345, partial [Paenibacillus sp. alder61]|uniref:hypothetical protein n=1 Tax=Paenibacillus sp. alder61 TaxID=2862948 RepID=UPI001CD8028F|nr:hypothetical protein [Paenibacillus sp. alder61]